MGIKKEVNILVQGNSYKFHDVNFSFGNVYQEDAPNRDTLIKLEFNAIQKFASSYDNYTQIGYDFFDQADPELFKTL